MVPNKRPMQSNLESLLEKTTPVVPSKILPKSEIKKLNRLWHPSDREEVEYFTLSDLWSSFDEWSVYGTGVPVTLNVDSNGTKKRKDKNLVQYFAPYLSAMQIYTSISAVKDERVATGTLYERKDSSSDSLSYESTESENLSRSDGSSDDGVLLEHATVYHNPKSKLGYLYCQYFEYMSPYGRIPFTDKIIEIAKAYPRLMSLRSVDLSPASWMAIYWYPIYHIPMGRNIKDLATCFLTYHTLSSSFQEDMNLESGSEVAEKKKRAEGEGISLAPFGLATYKMQGGIWVSDGGSPDGQRLSSLFGVAGSWLKQLNVQHHDFDFFARPARG